MKVNKTILIGSPIFLLLDGIIIGYDISTKKFDAYFIIMCILAALLLFLTIFHVVKMKGDKSDGK